MFWKKLKTEIGQLKVNNEFLSKENKRLRKELDVRRSIVALMEESIPKEQQERKIYMQKIAGFYGGIFKDKLAHMIYEQKDTLSRLGLTQVEETFLRSNINCLQLIDGWFEDRTNEHLADLQDLRERNEEDVDIIGSIKDKYLR